MKPTPITYTAGASFTRQLTTFATANDGYHSGELLDLLVTLAFPTGPTTLSVQHEADTAERTEWDAFTEWLDTYVAGHNLTGTMDFAPTTRLLALYLARVAAQMAPSAVSVTLTRIGGGVDETVVVSRD